MIIFSLDPVFFNMRFNDAFPDFSNNDLSDNNFLNVLSTELLSTTQNPPPDFKD